MEEEGNELEKLRRRREKDKEERASSWRRRRSQEEKRRRRLRVEEGRRNLGANGKEGGG